MWGPKLVQNLSECKYWYHSLKEWSESTNPDDSKLAWKCLESFLKTLAVEFKRNQDAHQETFQYLLKTFTAVIKNSATGSKVIHSRPENLKKPRPKKLVKSNKSISGKKISPKIHFLQFQKWPKIIF